MPTLFYYITVEYSCHIFYNENHFFFDMQIIKSLNVKIK